MLGIHVPFFQNVLLICPTFLPSKMEIFYKTSPEILFLYSPRTKISRVHVWHLNTFIKAIDNSHYRPILKRGKELERAYSKKYIPAKFANFIYFWIACGNCYHIWAGNGSNFRTNTKANAFYNISQLNISILLIVACSF